jgi:hypothetical protein
MIQWSRVALPWSKGRRHFLNKIIVSSNQYGIVGDVQRWKVEKDVITDQQTAIPKM